MTAPSAKYAQSHSPVGEVACNDDSEYESEDDDDDVPDIALPEEFFSWSLSKHSTHCWGRFEWDFLPPNEQELQLNKRRRICFEGAFFYIPLGRICFEYDHYFGPRVSCSWLGIWSKSSVFCM